MLLLTGSFAAGRAAATWRLSGRDYLFCSNARKLKSATSAQSIRLAVLEDFVLDLFATV